MSRKHKHKKFKKMVSFLCGIGDYDDYYEDDCFIGNYSKAYTVKKNTEHKIELYPIEPKLEVQKNE